MIGETFHVCPVPAGLTPVVWPQIAPHLMIGLTAAIDCTPQTLAEWMVRGYALPWVITDRLGVAAAFFTSVYDPETASATDAPHRFIGVYALGAANTTSTRPRWADQLRDAMLDYARRENVAAVRFMGRRAWRRLLPDFTVIGQAANGHHVYERMVA